MPETFVLVHCRYPHRLTFLAERNHRGEEPHFRSSGQSKSSRHLRDHSVEV